MLKTSSTVTIGGSQDRAGKNEMLKMNSPPRDREKACELRKFSHF